MHPTSSRWRLFVSFLALDGRSWSLRGEEGKADASATPEAIPWCEIGGRAEKEYEGDGLSVVATGDGAVLHSVFQRLRGDATPGGLWLNSTVEDAVADRFRV